MSIIKLYIKTNSESELIKIRNFINTKYKETNSSTKYCKIKYDVKENNYFCVIFVHIPLDLGEDNILYDIEGVTT